MGANVSGGGVTLPSPRLPCGRSGQPLEVSIKMRAGESFPRFGISIGRLGCPLLIVLGVLGAIGVFLSGATVQAGHVGVKLTFGAVSPAVLDPGFHPIIPGIQRIVQVDTRVLPHSFREIEAASREYQSVKLTGTMNYHLEAQRANELYQTVGLDFADKVIDPAFNDFIKEVVPRYSVIDILAKRDEIRGTARDMLGRNLQRYGIVVDDIYISNISFSKEYQDAIERKQTAQQNVETEQQILAQKEIQAQQVVADARGRADARVLAAEADAKANDALTASISPQLIDYLRWTKWDGRLPLFSGGQSPFVSIPLERLEPSDGGSASPSPAPATSPAPAAAPVRPSPTAVQPRPTPSPGG